MLAAIVLAGGGARRFGGGKLLALLAGRPLIEHALDRAAAAPVASLLLVTGAEPAVAEAGALWSRARSVPLRIIDAADHAEGLAASLRSGLRALPPDTEGAFIFLGDMPLVPAALTNAMAAELVAGATAVAPSHAGRRGHPVLLGRDLIAQARALNGDRGAGPLLDAAPGLVLLPTDDDGVLIDIDTVEDLAAVEERLKS